MTHNLKIRPAYFAAIKSGVKRFEYRDNDRDYNAGDTLRLREYDTGEELSVTVDYILKDTDMPPRIITKGYCIMSVSLPPCGVCGAALIRYETMDDLGADGEPWISSAIRAKYCPNCGRKLEGGESE